jgi:hypothetical protein
LIIYGRNPVKEFSIPFKIEEIILKDGRKEGHHIFTLAKEREKFSFQGYFKGFRDASGVAARISTSNTRASSILGLAGVGEKPLRDTRPYRGPRTRVR